MGVGTGMPKFTQGYPCHTLIYRRTLAAAVLAWSNLTEANIGQCDMTASTETAQCHALEIQKRDLAAIQVLENKLNISQQWE